jgi:uncharacterized protein YidB (DUF937 family)
MSLLNKICSAFQDHHQQCVAGILELLADHHTSLGDMVKQFEREGLGDQVASWLGNGPNLPLDPQKLVPIFGQDRIAELAGKLGCNQDQALGMLAEHLPRVIDELSPEGVLPEQSNWISMTAGLTGGMF